MLMRALGTHMDICMRLSALGRTDRRRQYIVDEWIDAFDLPLSDHLQKSQPVGLFNGSWSWRDVGERIAYRYFCWRQVLSNICL